ncbi:MAG: hypothetical protein R2795_24845 [Saprospiraceae bacterium]
MAQKDIFDLFRESADALNTPPSAPTWGRIERRLQGKRPSVRRASVHRLPPMAAVAAAFALLIGAVVVFSWVGNRPTATQNSMAVSTPIVVEDLAITLGGTDAMAIAEIAISHPQPAPTKPIQEGKAGQKLMARSEQPSFRTAPTPRHDSTRQRHERDVMR